MKEYWFCLVGPVERDELSNNGADLNMRNAIKVLLENFTDIHIFSGWGVPVEKVQDILDAFHDAVSSNIK